MSRYEHTKEKGGFEWCKFNVPSDISTEDCDKLTKLVVACLEFGVRAEVAPAGPWYLRVSLFPRFTRTGMLHERVRATSEFLSEFNEYKHKL